MRELVYLSDAKLAQFRPELRGLWPKTELRLQTRVPFVDVGMDVAANQDGRKIRDRHLTRVIDQITRTAEWFADPAVRPGQWVQIAAPLNYLLLDRADFAGLVLFADRATAGDDDPPGGEVRVLLHGSAKHLATGLRPHQVPLPAGEDVVVKTSNGGAHSGGPVFLTTNNIALLLNTLDNLPAPTGDGERAVPRQSLRHLPSAVDQLVRTIDGRLYPELAAWMAGWARVSANLTHQGRRYLIASPLILEYGIPDDLGPDDLGQDA